VLGFECGSESCSGHPTCRATADDHYLQRRTHGFLIISSWNIKRARRSTYGAPNPKREA